MESFLPHYEVPVLVRPAIISQIAHFTFQA
jgi:hypothetical protein